VTVVPQERNFFSIAVTAMVGKVAKHGVLSMQTHDLKTCNVLSDARQDCEGLGDIRGTGQTTLAVQSESVSEKFKKMREFRHGVVLVKTFLTATALSAATLTASYAIAEEPEYFLLRPEVEKAYGYSHAVKIGNDIKVSGAVSMDDAGTPTAVDDMEQQMKNVYDDLAKVLDHYGYTFDDVTVERVYTTDMAKFLEVSAYRTTIYPNHFPTGTWAEVKGLALPEFMIEIEIEAYKSN